jgi:peptidase M42 family hydrolase
MPNTPSIVQKLHPIAPLSIHEGNIIATLMDLLSIPSPAGYTDAIVHYLAERFEARGVDYELTRRGAMRVNLAGRQSSPDRAVLAHVDTLGAQVKRLKENGRLELVPIGFWSARFAEGARVTVLTDAGSKRGTILPLKASGHTFNKEIDELPISWQHIELRVDERVSNERDLIAAGFNVGDIVSIDPKPEFLPNGYINSRHLDDKAGVAAMIAALDAIVDAKPDLPVDCHFLFTISEEVGSGASAVLHGDVSEMVAVDNGTVAPGQNSSEYGVTIAMGDQTGPFDWHLTQHLLRLAREHAIDHQRDVFRYYRCDAASAIEAGNDIRTALITFGIDASHGYERVHLDALMQVARLLTVYVQSPPVIARDKKALGDIEGFPDHQPTRRAT